MVELPLQNVKATAVLEIYRETHVKPSARKCDECKNKLKCRMGIIGRYRTARVCFLKDDMREYLRIHVSVNNISVKKLKSGIIKKEEADAVS